jgi:hypothetical protein
LRLRIIASSSSAGNPAGHGFRRGGEIVVS